MALTNTELRYYDSNVLRLPADKRKEYHAQVDRLIDELRKGVKDKTEIKITKVVKAGSFAKFTILRKTTYDPVDVDVVFYISGRDASKETLDSLNETIYALLIKIYPNKSVEDFEIIDDSASVMPISSATCQRIPSSMQNRPISAPQTTICSAPPPNTEARSFHRRCGSSSRPITNSISTTPISAKWRIVSASVTSFRPHGPIIQPAIKYPSTEPRPRRTAIGTISAADPR